MIFSEADMIAKGYKISDLTDTERRMQNVLEETYTDLMYLVNYYDMDNEVLLSAAAMYATFNFNREFSQTNVIGESVMMYPQNFEMKNFNHDAFLRLALLNSTGETVFSKTDLFETVLSKTSVFTGILLLVEDVLANIIIPTMKMIMLLMLLFLGVLICVVCALQPPEKIVQAVSKAFIFPTILFMLSTIIFAQIVSFMLGSGLTSYVGSKNMSIATNDPTITILLLIVVDIIFIIVLVKLMKMLFNSLKNYGFIGGSAIFGLVTDTIGRGIRKTGNILKGATLGALPNALALNPIGTVGGAIVGAADGATDGKISGGISKALFGHNVTKKLYKTEKDLIKSQKNFANSLDNKASSYRNPSAGYRVTERNRVPELKQNQTKNGTVLGNTLEGYAYKKNQVQDKINAASHSIKKFGNTVEDISTGAYFTKSIQQAKNADLRYEKQRKSLDLQRKASYLPNQTTDVINKMRNQRG